MMSLGTKWKEAKHEAKTSGYDPYDTDIERLAHCPDNVEEDQWRSLVHYWSSENAQEKSKRNKESQKKLTMPHTSGRKSHAQIIDEKQMDDIAEVHPELNIPGSVPNDVYSKVIGPDTHGIVRTLGKRATPSFVYGPVYKRAQAEKRDFDARVELEVQKASSAMKIEMAEKLAEAQKEIEAMDKKLSEAKEEAKEDKKQWRENYRKQK
ncbi:uncharacterized protein LOC107877032 [Capsicum annuum]|nr:uncharacterized protein LOC107877032 [Capsicum annuum]XP_016579313.1 uncharacterized protein LOC107877032 [Capsicum annuum]